MRKRIKMKKTFPLCFILLAPLALASLTGIASYHSSAHISAALGAFTRSQDCVHCATRGDCKSCQGGGTSSDCNTPDCSTCWTGGTCGGGGGIGGIYLKANAQSGLPSRSDSDVPLRIGQDVIEEIAAVHPRFGATLANINVFGFYDGLQHVYWAPVKISANDIDAFLSRREHTEYFAKLNNRARRLNRLIQEGKATEIVYDLVVESSDSKTRTIKMQVTSNPANPSVDPPYASLQITLHYAEESSKRLAGVKPIGTTWQIN
jgi:hypothetical protein